MSELFLTLGINWKLLLAQAANFLVIVVVLRFTIYKPLIRILSGRRLKIEQGLKDADAAKEKLGEINQLERERLAEAEKEALGILARSEESAKAKEIEMLKGAKRKEEEIMEAAEKTAAVRKEEATSAIYDEAAKLVKAAMVKTASMKPEAIDDVLINDAVSQLKKTAKV